MEKITLLTVGISFCLLQLNAQLEGTSDGSITVFFERSSYRNSEFILKPAPIRLCLSSSLSTNVTIRVLDQWGTAVGGSVDYIFNAQTITFHAGSIISSALLYQIYDECLVEFDEYFDLIIDPSTLPNNVALGHPSQARVTIEDNDRSFVYFSQPQYWVYENYGSVQLNLLFYYKVSVNLNITIMSDDITAEGDGIDYNSGPYTVIVSATETKSAVLNIPIIDDTKLEGNESFSVIISSTSHPEKVFISKNGGHPYQAEVYIVNDDMQAATISFNQSTYAINEHDETVSPVLVLSNPLPTDINVQITDNEDTAKSDSDYSPGGLYNITIPAGQTNFSFDISIIDDNILEENKTFDLIIILRSLPSDIGLDGANRTKIVIVDDDTATINFEQLNYIANESDGIVQPVLILSNPSSFVITVEVFYFNRSATVEEDYTILSTVVFNPNMTQSLVSISIIDDNILEGNESIDLFVNSSSLHGNLKVRITRPNQVTVIIVDNDLLQLEFAQSNYSGLERSGYISVTLLLKGNSISTHNINVTVTPTDQSPVSAEGSGVDYYSNPIIASFNAGANITKINISVINDNITEETETFNLILTNISSPTGQVVLGSISKAATGSIIDDTITTIKFNDSMYNINESSRAVQLVLLLSNPLSRNIAVELINTDISAFGNGVDYESGPYSVSISAGETTSVPLSIPINDDDILEGNEEFHLSFNLSLLPNYVNVTNPKNATVIIMDDDVLSVEFDSVSYRGLETSGNISITLLLKGGISANNISVTVTPFEQLHVLQTHGAKGNGVDFISSPITATFIAGTIITTIDVPVIIDNIIESLEVFGLNISIPPSLEDQVILGGIAEAIAYITDNTIVRRVAGEDIKVEMDYRVYIDCGPKINGTGPNVTWYYNGLELFNGSIPNVILSQDKRQCIITNTLYDIEDQIGNSGNYTCEVCSDLNNPCTSHTSTVNVCGKLNLLPLLYEPVIHLPYVALTCGQNITISPSSVMFVSIVCIAFGGSKSVTTEVFKNGKSIGSEFSRIITPFGNDDFGNYTFVASTIRCGSISATSWIFSDQILPANVSFERQSYTVNETDGSVQLLLVLSNPPTNVITVKVFTTNGSAVGGGVDYALGSFDVQFDVGATSAPFTVSIINDNILELNETFYLNISASSLPGGITAMGQTICTVTILDNDNTEVSFEPKTYTVAENVTENDGKVNLSLVLRNSSSTDIRVEVLCRDDDLHTASFNAGEIHATISVPVHNETFYCKIQANSLPSRVFGNLDPCKIIIVKNNDTEVRFEPKTYTVNENDGKVNLSLVLSKPSSTDIRIEVLCRENDYYNVSFNAGETTVPFSVQIHNETFICKIVANSLPSGVIGNFNPITVVVLENDDSEVSFGQKMYAVSKTDGKVKLSLVLSAPSSTDLKVKVLCSSNDQYNVSFNAGETNATFNVPIRNETFNCTIKADSLPSRVIGNFDPSTIIIMNECKVNNISGDFKKNNGEVIFKFSADHPDATFKCKVGTRRIQNCKSPLVLKRRVKAVIVKAFCIIDGKERFQKRKRFVKRS